MWDLLKRLVLGLSLIAACSAVLLYSDRASRQGGAARRTGPIPVALVQHASIAPLDDAVQGLLQVLGERGWLAPEKIRLQKFNSESDIAMANTIAGEVTSGPFELIITISTISLQTVANANRGLRPVRHVFGMVSDPCGAGVGIDRNDPLRHPPYMTGYGNLPPVRDVLELARRVNPALRRVGLVWNPAEANSVASTEIGRQVCTELGLELIEANADSAAVVLEATQAVISRGAEAIWLSGDVTTVVAADSLINTALKSGVPVFSVNPGTVSQGALCDLGGDFLAVGRNVGELVVEALEGRNLAEIPVENRMPKILLINETVLPQLKGNWQLSPELRREAQGRITAAGEDLPERFRSRRPK